MRYNRKQLKQDLKDKNHAIRELKAKMHEPYTPNFGWQERRDLRHLKLSATLHHACAAHLRGKIHLTNWQPEEGPRRPMTMEEQRQMIAATLEKYALPDEPAAEAAA